jgi:hypothetical protein
MNIGRMKGRFLLEGKRNRLGRKEDEDGYRRV